MPGKNELFDEKSFECDNFDLSVSAEFGRKFKKINEQTIHIQIQIIEFDIVRIRRCRINRNIISLAILFRLVLDAMYNDLRVFLRQPSEKCRNTHRIRISL